MFANYITSFKKPIVKLLWNISLCRKWNTNFTTYKNVCFTKILLLANGYSKNGSVIYKISTIIFTAKVL